MRKLLFIFLAVDVALMLGACSTSSKSSDLSVFGDVPDFLNVNQPLAEIENASIIPTTVGKYAGWPTVCARQNGELIVGFSGDRDAHVCPYGKVQLVRSSDNGTTWSAPETVVNTVFDDRDAGVIQLKNGNILLSTFNSFYYKKALDVAKKAMNSSVKKGDITKIMTSKMRVNPDFYKPWEKHIELISEKDFESLGSFIYLSADGGKKWSSAIKVVGSSPHGPTELSDGRLLYVGKYEDRRSDAGNGDIIVEESTDGGKSWRVISKIEPPKGFKKNHCFEPHAVECADGKIVVHVRNHKTWYLLQSESTDGGKTWSTMYETKLFGYPSHLLRLKDGTLLASYGRRCHRDNSVKKENGWLIMPDGRKTGISGVFACFSYDNGKTWDVKNEIILSLCDADDLGYPSSVQLKDGSIVTVYYQKTKNGRFADLVYTKWKPKNDIGILRK